MDKLEQINNLRKILRNIPVEYHTDIINFCDKNIPYSLSRNNNYYYHIVFVKTGSIIINLGNQSKQQNYEKTDSIALKDGCIAIFSHGLDISSINYNDNTVYYSVDFTLLNEKTNVPYNTTDLCIYSQIQNGTYYDALFKRFKELFLLNHHPLERHLNESLLHFIMGEFYSQIKHPWENKFKNKLIESICAKINSNPKWNPTLDELAEEINISKYHFSRLFKENTGMSPKHYISQVRLRYARKMIVETGCSIKKAADLIGYPDIYSFSKQFKKIYGYPPSKIK